MFLSWSYLFIPNAETEREIEKERERQKESEREEEGEEGKKGGKTSMSQKGGGGPTETNKGQK